MCIIIALEFTDFTIYQVPSSHFTGKRGHLPAGREPSQGMNPWAWEPETHPLYTAFQRNLAFLQHKTFISGLTFTQGKVGAETLMTSLHKYLKRTERKNFRKKSTTK